MSVEPIHDGELLVNALDGVPPRADRSASAPRGPTILPGVRDCQIDFTVTPGRHVEGQIVHRAHGADRIARLGYDLPRSWSSDHHLAALRLAAHWFRDVGGFEIVNKAVLCHIVQRLQAGFREDHCHWAIDAYMESKRAASEEWRNRRMSIGAFFGPDQKFVAWRDRSPKWKAHVAQASRGACPRAPESPKAPQPSAPSASSAVSLSDQQLRAAYRKIIAQRAADAEAHAEYHRACRQADRQAYESMPEPERARLYSDVEAQFSSGRERGDGTVRVDPGSDHFREALHKRAWVSMVSRDAATAKRFAYPPPPQSAIRNPQSAIVESEVKRRACQGLKYPKRPWAQGMAEVVAEQEQELIQEWLNSSAECGIRSAE